MDPEKESADALDEAVEILEDAPETEAEEVETPEGEAPDDDTDAEPVEDAESEDSDAVTVTIGDEEPDAEVEKAPDWVRDLRKKERDGRKRIRELESKLQERAPHATQIGQKPTLESVDYDEGRFEAALTAWHDQKRQVDVRKQTEAQKAKDAQAAWTNRIAEYDDRKKALKVSDFDDAEIAVESEMSVTQQGIILQASENPEVVIYALGKHPAKMKELAAIADPIRFTAAVARLEGTLNVKPRAPKTRPEKRLSPNAGTGGGSTDNTLEKLRAKADKSGDMSEVLAYKRKMRQAAK